MFSDKMLDSNNLLLHHRDARTVLSIRRKRAEPDATWQSKCVSENNLPATRISFDNCSKNTTRSRFCNFYKMQSYTFLLIILCAIVFPKSSAYPVKASGQRLILHSQQHRLRQHQKLLQQHRQFALSPAPTQRHHHHLHHRSVSNMAETLAENNNNDVFNNNNNNDVFDNNNIRRDFCRNSDHLKNMLEQVNKTYSYIFSLLSEYTKRQHNKSPEILHETWLKHMFQLDHPLRTVLERDFYKEPNVEHFQHIINKPLTTEMVEHEMQKVYSTLKILQIALEYVIQYRIDNKIQIIHDLHNNFDNFKAINNFFEEVNKMVNVDIDEVIKFMEKLQIPLPEVNIQKDFHKNMEVRDWLLASEHLSVTQYLRVLYMTLLKKCPEGEE